MNLGGNNLSIPGNGPFNSSYGGAILYAGGASNTYTIAGSGLFLCATNAFTTQPELLLNAATGATLIVNCADWGSDVNNQSGRRYGHSWWQQQFQWWCIHRSRQGDYYEQCGARFAPSVSLASGTTFDVNGFSVNGGISLSGNGVDGNGALINSSQSAASFSSTNSYLTFNGNLTIGATGDIQLGKFQIFQWGPNVLTKVGPGTLSIASSLTYPTNGKSGLIINGGRFQCQASDIVDRRQRSK